MLAQIAMIFDTNPFYNLSAIKMLVYCHIKTNPTVFKSFTGFNMAEFEDLLPHFETAWDEYREETFVIGISIYTSPPEKWHSTS